MRAFRPPSIRRVNLDRSPVYPGSKERVDTTASSLMGFQGPGSHVDERSRRPDGHGLAAAVQSRMAGANVARVTEGDETATSVLNLAKRF